MDKITFTKADARKIILHAAGLSKPTQFGKGKEAALKVIDHLGFLQVDTNYVVERAHHHMLASRIPNYKPEWLEELQSDGRIFEYFTADAGFLPMTDFKYSLPLKETFKAKRDKTSRGEINLMSRVLDRIAREGPLMARDFENDRVEKSKGWWDWRPSKVALERLYLEGSLMTLRTKNFQKIYDLPVNIIPTGIDVTMPSAEEFSRYIIFQSLKRLGIAYANEIAWSAHFIKGNSVKEEIKKMAGDGEISEVRIDGVKGPLYMLPEYRKKRIMISDNVFILSPFDALNVFRHRLKSFFDFDYQIECFVPREKRKYGYFSLPIIKGDRFLARMDSKADRTAGTLIIHNIHFEAVKITKGEIISVSDAIKAFAKFNQCESIVVSKSNNKELLKTLRN